MLNEQELFKLKSKVNELLDETRQHLAMGVASPLPVIQHRSICRASQCVDDLKAVLSGAVMATLEEPTVAATP